LKDAHRKRKQCPNVCEADDDRIRQHEDKSIFQTENVPTDGTITAAVGGTKTSVRRRFLGSSAWAVLGRIVARLFITWSTQRKAQ
jgi:hypothetical protein